MLGSEVRAAKTPTWLWVKNGTILGEVNSPPRFRTYFSGWIESDVHWGYGILDFDPWPHLSCSVAPILFPFFGGCPTKNGPSPKKGSLFSQGH